MYKAIASLGAIAILSHFAFPANAQLTPTQVNPTIQTQSTGAATLLQGLQERSIKHSFPSRRGAEATQISKANDSTDGLGVQLDKNVQLRVKPETDTSQVGVFPGDNNAKGNQFQLIYQFDDQLNQFSRPQR